MIGMKALLRCTVTVVTVVRSVLTLKYPHVPASGQGKIYTMNISFCIEGA